MSPDFNTDGMANFSTDGMANREISIRDLRKHDVIAPAGKAENQDTLRRVGKLKPPRPCDFASRTIWL